MARLSKKRERELLEKTNYAKISLSLGIQHAPEVFPITVPVSKPKPRKKS